MPSENISDIFLDLLPDVVKKAYSENDMETVNLWLQSESKSGNSRAQYVMGAAYAIGLDRERNPEKAREYFEKAAKKGYSPALNSLGVIYLNGVDVEPDHEKAKEILEEDEIYINIDLHQGEASAKAWGCDLTYDYVKINGDYRS